VSDWRVPNVNELETLTNADAVGFDELEFHGFSNLVETGYWTSSTHRLFLPGNGWFVDLYAGAVSNTDKTDVVASSPCAAARRTGRSIPPSRRT
jgi:hypothetical protein